MDKDRDSLRFYNLGNSYHTKIEHFGVKPGYEADGLLML
jgi:CRISPR-associated protein Cas2